MNEPKSQIILYQTEDGRTRIECRFENETIWLSQALMAELFQTTIPNVNLHLKNIFAEGELREEATIKEYLIVRQEGQRQVSRAVLHYNLEAVIAVGYRIKSERGTRFRQWATARLKEYLVKGFVLDDERLKNPPGPGVPYYFDELLERIRDIRASEKRMPDWFKIETPLGTYNPDWAIVKEDENGQNKVYLVRETKGTNVWLKVPEIQRKKIQCGKAHFKAIGFKPGEYDWVDSANKV